MIKLLSPGVRPSGVDYRYSYKTEHKEFYPCVGLIEHSRTREGKAETFDAYKERVLKELGALKPDQTLDDLRLLPPPKESHGGPTYHRGLEKAERLPTKIPNLDASVNFAFQKTIAFWVDLPTLEKIVDFPKS